MHIFITTISPPKKKSALVRWGLGLAQDIRHRWQIETGFRDLNRINPTSHARDHETKTLMFAFQMFVYNAWQIQRGFHRRLRNVLARWERIPR